MDDDRDDPADLDLHRPEDPDAGSPELETGEPSEPAPAVGSREPSVAGPVLLALLALSAAGSLAFFLARRPGPPAPSPAPPLADATSPAASPTPTPVPTPSLPEAIMLPALDQSDALVRELVGRLSSHPQVAAWLGADQLVRRFVTVVVNLAEGDNPRPSLRFLEPRQRLGVLQRASGTVIDPQSYARFDGFAAGLESLDEGGCAQVHRLLMPLLEAAYRELGHPEGGFDRALAAALGPLLEVPALEGDVGLRPVRKATLVYEYADPRLEALSLPQKQLLRMGPANVRRVQAKLRALAAALGLQPAPVATP